MSRSAKPYYILLLLTLPLWQCKEQYVNPHVPATVSDLVIEGYISGNSPTQFTLSRTIPLPGDSTIPMETNAKVQVEGDDNSSYLLPEQTAGVYVDSNSLPLSATVKYRLRVTTSGGSVYLSDYVPYKPTPAIDSINWTEDPDGVNIFANTHDPANKTIYYQYEYLETWEYHSAEGSGLKYLKASNTVVTRPADEQIYRCWQSRVSPTILLASSAKLMQDEIYRLPLISIPTGSSKISVLYSTLVKQFALTEDGYNYLSLMKKNTESLGSIFDVQPSVLQGNIHSVSNPKEIVLGYISAGTVQQQRIYIYRSQLTTWPYNFTCDDPDKVVPDDPDSLVVYFTSAYVPLANRDMGSMKAFTANRTDCVDCRLQGGTNQKPSYWPL